MGTSPGARADPRSDGPADATGGSAQETPRRWAARRWTLFRTSLQGLAELWPWANVETNRPFVVFAVTDEAALRTLGPPALGGHRRGLGIEAYYEKALKRWEKGWRPWRVVLSFPTVLGRAR